jgi:hypothetical protein
MRVGLSRGGVRGLGLRMVRVGSSRVKGPAHRCATRSRTDSTSSIWGWSGRPCPGWPLTIVGSRAGHLWDALSRVYDALGFDQAAGGDEVFRQLVLARIIEPTSKLDSLRVLEKVGVTTPYHEGWPGVLLALGWPLWGCHR